MIIAGIERHHFLLRTRDEGAWPSRADETEPVCLLRDLTASFSSIIKLLELLLLVGRRFQKVRDELIILCWVRPILLLLIPEIVCFPVDVNSIGIYLLRINVIVSY